MHRGGLGAIYEIEALADGGAEVFLLGERGKYPPFGVNGGGPAALNRFVYETDSGEAIAAARLKDHRRQNHAAARRCGWRRRAAAASAIRPRAIPRASRATCGSAMCRASCAPRLQGRAARRRLGRCRRPPRRRAPAHERRRTSSSGSTSAAPSPTCFCSTTATGTFRTAKVPSRRGDEALGFLNGLDALGGAAGMHSIVHGTTVGTNTLLERRGPRIGVITTRGFRDVLEMRRRDRRRTWGLWGDFIPIADRDLRLEVERAHAGRRHHPRRPVDPDEVRAAGEAASAISGAQAVAIIFINAYANAENERRALADCEQSGRTNSSPLRTRCCRKSASSSAPRPRR